MQTKKSSSIRPKVIAARRIVRMADWITMNKELIAMRKACMPLDDKNLNQIEILRKEILGYQDKIDASTL